MRLQNPYHLLILFVRHHTENDPYTLRMKLFQECSERRGGRHIVSTIQEKASDLLQTAGPSCGVDAANNGGAANTKTLSGSNSSSDVFRLMAAKQEWMKIWISLEVFPCGNDQALTSPFANNRQICRRTCNHRFTTFDNPGFLSRNLFDGLAEELLMIETNARNDRNVLLHDVRRIEPPAEADFENGKAHPITEIEKSHSCD